jgi:hypothetical protein
MHDEIIDPWFPTDEVFELPGTPTWWVWGSSCADTACECRDVMIYGTDQGREVLLARLDQLDPVLRHHRRHYDTLPQMSDLLLFMLHLESGIVDARDHPLTARIDGKVLDGLDCFWHRRKGKSLPELAMLGAKGIWLPEGVRRGDHVFWRELALTSRRDLYHVGSQKLEYEASEQFCPDKICPCDTMAVTFWPSAAVGVLYPGTVMVNSVGKARFLPTRGPQRERLQELWTLYRTRYPDYRGRLARRSAFVREVASKFLLSEACSHLC